VRFGQTITNRRATRNLKVTEQELSSRRRQLCIVYMMFHAAGARHANLVQMVSDMAVLPFQSRQGGLLMGFIGFTIKFTCDSKCEPPDLLAPWRSIYTALFSSTSSPRPLPQDSESRTLIKSPATKKTNC
jgi:hypothetical protein